MSSSYYTDVLGLVDFNDVQAVKTQGNVLFVEQKQLQQEVLKIAGDVSAANYAKFTFNQDQYQDLQTPYLYFIIKVPASSLYTTHIEYDVQTSFQQIKSVRVSLSNLIQQNRVVNSTAVLSTPLEGKWTVVALDVQNVLQAILGVDVETYNLTGLTICSNVEVKGVYGARFLYTYNSFPDEINLKCKGSWMQNFGWVNPPVVEQPDKENVGIFNVRLKTVKRKKSKPKQNEQAKMLEIGRKKLEEEQRKLKQLQEEELKKKKKKQTVRKKQAKKKQSKVESKSQEIIQIKVQQKPIQQPRPEEVKIEQQVPSLPILEKDFEQPNDDESSWLEASKNQTPRRVTFDGIKCEESPIPHEENVMSPDPIVSLKKIIGYSGQFCHNTQWTRRRTNLSCYPPDFTEGSNKFLVYPAGNVLIMMNPTNQMQYYYFGHNNPIVCLDQSQDGHLIATGQALKGPQILLWDIQTRRAPISILFDRLHELKKLSISHRGNYLLAAGLDPKNNEIIVVWQISEITKLGDKEQPPIFAKQLSPFSIHQIKFSPANELVVVSCGNENIRFWDIRRGIMPGSSVILNQHSRDNKFTDLDFEVVNDPYKIDDENILRVFVSSCNGMIFQVDYQNRELDGVFQLHDGPIYSVKVTEGFCITGGQDRFIRLWPLNFSSCHLEAQQEAPVTSIDVSFDQCTIFFGTQNCTLNILNLLNNSCSIILRSHGAPINDIDIQRSTGQIVTTSQDNTMRIWSSQTFDELFEFYSQEDLPISVSFHPYQGIFAVGFQSGHIRVFDANSTIMIFEVFSHKNPIMKVQYSGNARQLIAIDQKGVVVLFDPNREYQIIMQIPVEITHDYVDVCFSQDSTQFGVLGTHSSTIFIWDSIKLILKFRINTSGYIVKQIHFAPNGQDILALCHGYESKIRYYGLNGFEGVFIKDFSQLHPSITTVYTSPNNKYLATGGDDKMIKLWDYASNPNQIQGQAFIGHGGMLSHIRFTKDGRNLISVAQDAQRMFIWDFYGDANPLQIKGSNNESDVKIIQEESLDDLNILGDVKQKR